VYEYEEDKIILAGRITQEEGVDDDALVFYGHLYTTLVEQQSNSQLTDTTDLKEYLNTYRGNFVDFHKLSNNGYIIVSDQVFLPESGNDLAYRTMGSILKLNSNRDSLWSRAYSYYNNTPTIPEAYGYAEHYILDSKLTPDGGIVCSGWIEQQIQDPSPFLQTPWIFKVDSMGCLEPGCQDIGVSEIVIGLQNSMNIYPNPAIDIAYISFNLPPGFHEVNTELIIINMQGQEVARQILSPTAFIAPVQLDFSNLADGVYTVHWTDGMKWYDSVKLIRE
jgi:hypothetical protein